MLASVRLHFLWVSAQGVSYQNEVVPKNSIFHNLEASWLLSAKSPGQAGSELTISMGSSTSLSIGPLA